MKAERSEKKRIVFSGINISQGGPLTILRYFHAYAVSVLSDRYEIIFLVKDKSLLPEGKAVVIEFPASQKTLFHKLYYEYFHFNKISKRLNPVLWISLNDVTPTVSSTIQCTYFHNATPFYRLSGMDFRFPSRVLLQKFYYHFFYRINLTQNQYVIVQQQFLKNYVLNTLKFPGEVLINRPISRLSAHAVKETKHDAAPFRFFYPTKPEVYKNIHVLIDAVEKLKQTMSVTNFTVVLTFSGDENRYARYLKKRMKQHREFVLSGYLDHTVLHQQYEQCDCLLFPSKLETWGLPLSEAMHYGKFILAADLPYSHETLDDYNSVAFFPPDNADVLATGMSKLIKGEMLPRGRAANASGDALTLEQAFTKILSL